MSQAAPGAPDPAFGGDGQPDGPEYRFDAERAGKRAECDGGGLTEVGLAGRDEFAGLLTGVFVETGYPPSRWYLMAAIEGRAQGESAWCEQGFLFVDGE